MQLLHNNLKLKDSNNNKLKVATAFLCIEQLSSIEPYGNNNQTDLWHSCKYGFGIISAHGF